jgi:hypothetical protein
MEQAEKAGSMQGFFQTQFALMTRENAENFCQCRKIIFQLVI